jgi:Na+-driven multidrug efflux pump
MSLGGMLWFLLPCAWILATEPLLTLHGVFKCAALLVLLAASITIPLPSSLFGETADG